MPGHQALQGKLMLPSFVSLTHQVLKQLLAEHSLGATGATEEAQLAPLSPFDGGSSGVRVPRLGEAEVVACPPQVRNVIRSRVRVAKHADEGLHV